MASVVYTNAKVFFGGLELTAQFNQVALAFSAEALDATVFGDTTRVMKGGLKDASATGRGFWAADTAGVNQVDPTLYDALGVSDSVLSLFPDGITAGSSSTGSGFAFKAVETRLTIGAPVGDLLPFDFAAAGRGVQA